MSNATTVPDHLRLACRQLASELLHATPEQKRNGPLRVLLTGSERGVGTSTLAQEVAGVLATARAGSVLLVGGRRLRGQVETGDDEVPAEHEPVRLPKLPPFESADDLSRVLERLGEGHGFVVLDADPIVEVFEVQLVADHCDVAWLVIASGRSRWTKARSAAALLRATKAGSTGVILNRKGRGLPRWLQRMTDRLGA